MDVARKERRPKFSFCSNTSSSIMAPETTALWAAAKANRQLGLHTEGLQCFQANAFLLWPLHQAFQLLANDTLEACWACWTLQAWKNSKDEARCPGITKTCFNKFDRHELGHGKSLAWKIVWPRATAKKKVRLRSALSKLKGQNKWTKHFKVKLAIITDKNLAQSRNWQSDVLQTNARPMEHKVSVAASLPCDFKLEWTEAMLSWLLARLQQEMHNLLHRFLFAQNCLDFLEIDQLSAGQAHHRSKKPKTATAGHWKTWLAMSMAPLLGRETIIDIKHIFQKCWAAIIEPQLVSTSA